MIRNITLLPQPLRPITTTLSDGATRKSTPRNTACPPNLFSIPWSFNIHLP